MRIAGRTGGIGIAQVLAVAIDPNVGLTAEHVKRLREWGTSRTGP